MKKNFYRSGWRPALGWVCVLYFGVMLLVRPIMEAYTGQAWSSEIDYKVVLFIMGMAGYRTIEKIRFNEECRPDGADV